MVDNLKASGVIFNGVLGDFASRLSKRKSKLRLCLTTISVF